MRIRHFFHRHWLSTMLAISITLSLIGFCIGNTIKSPAQLAAQAAEPTPTVITSPVESRVLTDTVDIQGTVKPTKTIQISGSGQTIPSHTSNDSMSTMGLEDQDQPAVSSGSSSTQVLTKMPIKAGDSIANGDLLAEISGRPMFVLQGEFPAYRDLTQGMNGADVLQLQQALATLGYYGGELSGNFDAATGTAVTAWYEANGYKTTTSSSLSEETSPIPTTTNNDTEDDTEDTAKHSSIVSTVTIPRSELVFAPVMPSSVATLNGAVGEDVSSQFLELSCGDYQVDISLDASQSDGVEVNMPVSLTVQESEIPNCAIHTIGSPTSGTVPMTITCASALDPALNGQTAMASIVKSTSDSEVLTVPISALTRLGDGTNAVIKVEDQNHLSRVIVTTGMSAQGFTQITPAEGQSLQAGDEVAVGGK